jgi:outer membrane protein OmpA-like peptidoglycan-associated protein
MRRLLFASVAIVPWLLFAGYGAQAQGTPSADQIIRALRPSGPLQTGVRGIRPSSPAAAPAAAMPAANDPRPSAAGTAPAMPAIAAAGVSGLPSMPPPAPAPQVAAPSIDLTVQFESGSAELTADAMRTLDELGRALSSEALAAFRFRIEGHTDTTGSRSTNMSLSQARAARVADYLQSRFGVSSERLDPVGRGQEALRVQTPDQTPEPRNRRVQVINIGA